MGDDYKRDYSVENGVNDDERFTAARNEAVFTQVFFIGAIFLAFAVAYGMSPVNPEKLTYFLGWPLWLVGGSTVFILATVLITLYIVWNGLKKEFNLDAKIVGEDNE